MATLHSSDASPLDFYLRRARRLLPAYAATVAVTLLLAFFIAVPSDFSQVCLQVFYASILSSNVGFALQNSYFSSFEFNPLLHLWSLAVECQFYLIFPFLIMAIRRWQWVLPTVLLISLATCIAGVMISPKLSFFLLPMRLWEFGIGIWAAHRSTGDRARKTWGGTVALAVMVLVPLVPIDGKAQDIVFGHPALGAIVVCLATCAALLLGQPRKLVDSFPGKTVQRLGNASYSIYLAHWPALVLLHYQPFGGTRSEITSIADGISSLIVVACASVALYSFCERRGPMVFTPLRAVGAAVGLVAAAFTLAPVQLQRFTPTDRRVFAAMNDRSFIRCGKLFRLLHPREQLCQIGKGERGVVLFIGDSFSDTLKETFASAASKSGLGSYFAVNNQPLIAKGLDSSWLIQEIRRRKSRVVYLHFTAPHFSEGVLESAKSASLATATRIIIILPPPVYDANVPQRIYLSHHGEAAPPPQTLYQYRTQTAKITKRSKELGFAVMDIAPLFCAPVCVRTDKSGRPLYFDNAHLTLTGADWVAPALVLSLRTYPAP